MEVRIQGTNLEITSEMRQYLDKRLSALNKLLDPEDSSVICDVELEKVTEHHQQGSIYRAEINLQKAGGTFRAEARRENLNDAIDEAKNNMLRELRRDKNKRIDMIRRGGARMKDFIRGFGRRRK